jgi:hypothetical protein
MIKMMIVKGIIAILWEADNLVKKEEIDAKNVNVKQVNVKQVNVKQVNVKQVNVKHVTLLDNFYIIMNAIYYDIIK